MNFATRPSIPQTDPPRPPRETLPTMYDLPSEFPEEPGLPDVGVSPSRDVFHDLQPQLLSRTLQLADYSRDHYFTGTDLNLYYDLQHPLWHKRPDWFLAVDVPRLYEQKDLRRSYVVWQEHHPPTVVVEFLSPGTEQEDLGRFYQDTDKPGRNLKLNRTASTPPAKVAVYEQYLRVPHYIVYSRYTRTLRYFQLIAGQYQERPIKADMPQIWLPDLQIGLGIWQGEFDNVPGYWLRWCDNEGNWLLTDTEQARQQAEQMAAKLRELGIDPESL